MKQMIKVATTTGSLNTLVIDIRDFIWDFNRLPAVDEVLTWAEAFQNIQIEEKTAQQLIRKGAKKAGWKTSTPK